ncbi:hypothetical protein C2S51_029727 [Perilla frutescens var. frutescens]|nr:hypothetical protein C2S51_029727 [Perilla frutescens var. frutescens]
MLDEHMATTSIMLCLPFLVFISAFPPTATSLNNETDLVSLLALKSVLEDSLGSLNSWNETTHFCSWKGIRCGRRHRDRVVAINLRSQGLVGPLSPHVGNLSFLRDINLQNNTFHGPIPQEISLLRRLELVEFSNNSFSGAIPKNLSQCPNLAYLNLIDNQFSGAIPPELGVWTSRLRALGLAYNKLSGSIPTSIGNLTSLTTLSFWSCGLEGEIATSLSQLSRLEFLNLGGNGLTGIVPRGLFNMSAMQSFFLYDNQLEGIIPSTALPNVRDFYLSINQFSGPIPVSIANASLLEEIGLGANYFTGPIPSLGRLTNLRSLMFESNLIEQDVNFLSPLTNFTNLESLEVYNNILTGSLPNSIANLSAQLSRLRLDMNKIHGKIPSGIGNLIGLTLIDFSMNYLDSPIPIDIARLSNLHSFAATANRFSDELPSFFGNLTSLIRLYLDGNNFSGNIPPSIGNCTELLELDLSRNNFTGLIPPEIMSISSLAIVVNMSYNLFEGSIPNEVGSLKNLGTLDLSYSRLSGRIPDSLSSCSSLQQLYLMGNLLQGEIPSALSALMGLQVLDLSRNNFSGPIPLFLSKMKIEKLNLSFNRLEGEVPTIGIFKNKTSISLDGNRDLCGGISELKFPPCTPEKSQKKSLFSTLLKTLIPIFSAGCICLILFAAFTCKLRASRKNVVRALSSFTGVQIMRLSYADLYKATGGFSEANLLGLGRFGSVYKGIVHDGQITIAVKVLNLSVRGSSRSFLAECNAIRNVRHRNLLKILSVCESIDFQGNEFKALVYEFKANGSLEKWLHQSDEEEGDQSGETNNLNMMQRLNIAVDIAEAIEYLHSGTDLCIIHGDLKPSNILLDHDMTAYVGDFGLAKIISDILIPSHESNSTSTWIRGTIGYVPPGMIYIFHLYIFKDQYFIFIFLICLDIEYGTSRLVSRQGDAYSYGIVLLEMFTNKRPTDDLFEDSVNLHCFVSAALPDRVMEVVDPQLRARMNNDKIKRCMASVLNIGVSCSKEMPRERTSMTDVVVELHKLKKLLSR